MASFGRFYLDKEKDIIVELDLTGDRMTYVLRTPNHATGNLITNLARLCGLPLSLDEQGLKVIRGEIPCYVDDRNRATYILHLGETKVANIYPDGRVERKAAIPAIAKTLMSQTKDYRLDFRKTLVKTWILRDYKFHTDLHTHMNANLDPDLLIALGIHHQIRYPLYYIRKLGLRCTPAQEETLALRRARAEQDYFAAVAAAAGTPLTGKYLRRRIDDNTFINFADLMLASPENAAYNLPRIRASLSILKDGQAVFTNLEKVYLYRYVFTKGVPFEPAAPLGEMRRLPDPEITAALEQMARDRRSPATADFSLFQNELLWIAREFRGRGVTYAEISNTDLLKAAQVPSLLAEIHEAMPVISRETGVTLRFLAAFRRTPLTLVRDRVTGTETDAQLRTLRAIAADPYVAGSDIVGEEINDIRELKPLIRELVRIAGAHPGFVIRIHAGENDSLRDNVANSLRCVRDSREAGQPMPPLRIGHGLYTANLHSARGEQLLRELRESGAVLEFQITSNVRLNNLSSLARHPLRDYLRAGIPCVQGTDGGAIYGTDSIDEQLALERLLDLTPQEMRAMRAAEDAVQARSLAVFARKQADFARDFAARGGADAAAFYAGKIREEERAGAAPLKMAKNRVGAEVLADRVREMPADRLPIVLLGGSFNSDRHVTPLREELCVLLRELVNRLDPEKVCFVVGHRVNAYERLLIQLAGDRFPVFAIVPATLTPAEAMRLRQAGVGIRVSIEPSGMGIYKSFAYEIFKRRPSLVLALDGNSAGANTIQEAKNGKHKAAIFVCRRSRLLAAKAATLEGYVSLFDGPEALEPILKGVEDGLQKYSHSSL